MRTIHYRQNKVNLDEFFCYWNNADEFSLSYVRDEDKSILSCAFPDSKVYGANMGPIWGRQDPGAPHVGLMNFAIWVVLFWTFLSYWNNAGDYRLSYVGDVDQTLLVITCFLWESLSLTR